MSKLIKIKLTIEIDYPIDETDSLEELDFRFNESSFCMDNFYDYIKEQGWCLCHVGKVEVIE